MSRTRRAVVVVTCALALTLAGCGGSDDNPSQGGPEQGAPPESFEPDAPDPSLASTIAVVDLNGEPASEPDKLDFASDAGLENIEWSDWGKPVATGNGVLTIQVCQPTCAAGKTDEVPATIELSEPVECDGQSYYSVGEILPSKDLKRGAPAVYVDPPCAGEAG